ncbi:UDP-N-acetylglucosamine 2-epimerase (non-hydrolysing) [Lampropedia hyalina DSM 16112]|jgi:UDP-N-acetylglucosamine 2-epimerase (non-hydrolysing)|uniref:UDP-N-acetylglucosamine 2-epimerase (non-hydrolyzing) n=1 Tax=Lampropedia hyalina DSM 16112 TaxID=1122156 RepID=A0A1M4T5I1_9BURK|nr:UDP-N-acetylglucosamine 2-epimerase (non-hydrolyzing) [Lampropedia hyalina]SHE39665.1 UDP-N-acetylglucosamine 2-epimerase (non-hydrolysing) [Lampropedia hyalina DSM 16112]
MRPILISFVFGTRPELVKLAPLILAAQADARFAVEVVFTAQHDELVRDAIGFFGIHIDHRLDMMQEGQSLTQLLARGLQQIERVYADGRKRDVVVVQGDTTTVLAASLVAFAHKISLAHVEAGLRSFDLEHPFPEEGNRQLVSRLAHWHFAPTPLSARNLENEGVAGERILVTGNTVVDAVHWARQRLSQPGTESAQAVLSALGLPLTGQERLVLVTAHRRENFGEGIRHICDAVARLVQTHENLHVVWPVHLNPAVRDVVRQSLGDNARVHLLPPLNYPQLMAVLQSSHFALTDSGGIQEECPSFGKPVLILRTTTERPEVVQAGAGRLVGTDADLIVHEAGRLLDDAEHFARMAGAENPFGDGRASLRILERIATDVCTGVPPQALM